MTTTTKIICLLCIFAGVDYVRRLAIGGVKDWWLGERETGGWESDVPRRIDCRYFSLCRSAEIKVLMDQLSFIQ